MTVTNGFMSCIGYKVLLLGVEQATSYKLKWTDDEHRELVFNQYKQLLAALPTAFGLYFLKRQHWGKAMYNFPLLLIVPTVVLYIILAATGTSIDQATCPSRCRYITYLEPIR